MALCRFKFKRLFLLLSSFVILSCSDFAYESIKSPDSSVVAIYKVVPGEISEFSYAHYVVIDSTDSWFTSSI